MTRTRICAWCGQSLPDADTDLQGPGEASHGICESCADKLRPVWAIRWSTENHGAGIGRTLDYYEITQAECDRLNRERSTKAGWPFNTWHEPVRA